MDALLGSEVNINVHLFLFCFSVKQPQWDNRRKMRNGTVEIGKPIELNCKLKRRAFPSVLYKWLKNDVDITTLNISGLSIKNTK